MTYIPLSRGKGPGTAYTQGATPSGVPISGTSARQSMSFAPASTQINQQTAPTAAPSTIQGARNPDSLRAFNSLLSDLLVKSQNIDQTGYIERGTNFQKEALSRASAATTGEEKRLSPAQQSQIRGARVGAIEEPAKISAAQQKEFQSKVENIPNLLKSMSQFAEQMKEEEPEATKFISQTFKEDDAGNVTWIGIDENQNVVKRDLGQIGTPDKAGTKTVTAGGRTLLIDTATGETIKDLGGAYKTGTGTGGTGMEGGTETPDDGTEPLTEYDKGRKIIADNPNLSDAELKLKIREGTELGVTDTNSLVNVREKPSISPKDQIEMAIMGYRSKEFSREEAENAIKTSIIKKYNTEKAELFNDMIKDALVAVYGRTKMQKAIPFGR